MSRKELLDKVMAGDSVDHSYGDPAEWRVEPGAFEAHPDGEVMVGRSLRLPAHTYERVMAVANDRRMSFSALLRVWVDEGLAAADGAEADPVVALRHGLDQARRAADQLASRV
ncbi:hypothetical protein GCM10009682_45450 [Luedemannella flava]|uniref:CopG family transcriptional regulator n=1 Tax=Luedemannella flava TaxID=349316 RepID=A0ABP4YMI0_9ACTN